MDRKGKNIISKSFYIVVQNLKILFQIPRGCCRFTPTCSEFAKEAITKLPITKAFFIIVKRILKCHPFHAGGYDPVEDYISTKG